MCPVFYPRGVAVETPFQNMDIEIQSKISKMANEAYLSSTHNKLVIIS